MKKTLATLIVLALASCTTAQQQQALADAKAAAPFVQPIADTALAATGNAGAVPAFNALWGMAQQAWLGNPPATGAGTSSTAAAVAAAVTPLLPTSSANAQALALSQAAAMLPVP